MALVVTLGSKTATSMVTVAEADAHMTAGPYPTTAWTALTTAQKEFRLILSAKYMTNRLTYKGWPLHINQSMPFPRAWPIPKQRPSRYYSANRYLTADWLTDTVPTDEETAAMDYIPDGVKQFQSLFAYGVIHRGLVSVTDPATGASGEPQVKELDLFDSLKIVASDKEIPLSDTTSFEALIRSEHFHLRLLIDDWVMQWSAVPGPRITFQLEEVA